MQTSSFRTAQMFEAVEAPKCFNISWAKIFALSVVNLKAKLFNVIGLDISLSAECCQSSSLTVRCTVKHSMWLVEATIVEVQRLSPYHILHSCFSIATVADGYRHISDDISETVRDDISEIVISSLIWRVLSCQRRYNNFLSVAHMLMFASFAAWILEVHEQFTDCGGECVHQSNRVVL